VNSTVGNYGSGVIIIPERVYDGNGNAYVFTKIGDDSFLCCSDRTSVKSQTLLFQLEMRRLGNAVV
jgi:hypothetical protein